MSNSARQLTTLPLLSVEGLTHSFVDPQGRNQNVLDDLSFSLAHGESVALWGPSGSGKTTLLNLVAGLLKPNSGRIELRLEAQGGAQSVRVTDLNDDALLDYRCRHIGYVFQFFNLIETLSVAENVRLALELAGKVDQFAAYFPQFAALGLGDLVDRFPSELSGGEQQRVAVLRALAHAPALVLADEPTGNLDRTNSERVAELLWQQVQEQKAALLVATHSEAIANRADRVIEIGSF